MTVTSEELSKAYARLYGADDVYRAAEKAVTHHAAHVLRLELMNFLEDCQSVVGVRYSSEFCYDDEGGYFRSIGFRPEMDNLSNEQDEEEAESALQDLSAWSIEAVEEVFDTTDEWEGSITREKLLAGAPASA